MPWCPKCRQEYLDTVKSCAECGATLVADLSVIHAAEARQQEAQRERVVRIVGPEPMLAGIAQWLERSELPFDRVEDGLGVPAVFAERVAAILESSADLEREGDVIRVLGPATGREPQLPSDPEIVRRSLDELAVDPAGSVPKLLALFAGEAPRPKRWAAAQLLALERRNVVALGDVVVWLAREGYRKPLFGLVEEVADAPPPGLAARVAAELPRLDTHGLLLALHVLTRLPDRKVVKSVLPLLAHEDAEVRVEADEVLMSATGFDVQFDAEADARVRERAIRQWRAWIAENVRD